MKPGADSVRVLVATDQVHEAAQILRVLEGDFEHVQSSTIRERAVEDFESFRPHVLVLAFDRLEKAQRHCLGLYRLASPSQRHPHRTIVLCGKDEVRAAYDLCRDEYFDDYVVFWPHTFDAYRLAMSIRIASRELRAARSDGTPSRAELFEHAHHLQVLEKRLGDEWRDGQQRVLAARSSLQQFEDELAGTFERLWPIAGVAETEEAFRSQSVTDRLQAFEDFKQRQLEQVRRVRAEVVAPMSDWALTLKDRIEPSLAGTRAMVQKVGQIRPVVMVVDDDELIAKLVLRTLDAEAYEVVSATESALALRLLRRMRPDVILMDIRMPGTDGVELTRQLKATPQLRDVPVIMLTGDARRETVALSLEAGAEEFVVKPFSRESLRSKVARVLAHRGVGASAHVEP